MPVATVGPNDDAVRRDLKTCPPDGFVMIRRAPYGDKLDNRAATGKMTVKARKGQKDVESVIDAFNTGAALKSFATCIVDHNLTDKNGTKLNFADPAHVRALDPRIGEEIETYIDELNNFEDNEDLGNSSKTSTSAS